MTGADLCASAKPWEAQQETVRVIFEEFYEQGDIEKRAGRVPIPMMDREKESEQPASQVCMSYQLCYGNTRWIVLSITKAALWLEQVVCKKNDP